MYEWELMHHPVRKALPLIPNNVAKASWHYQRYFDIGFEKWGKSRDALVGLYVI